MKAPPIIENEAVLTFELLNLPSETIDLSDGSNGSCGFSHQLLQYAEPGSTETSAVLVKPFTSAKSGQELIISLLDGED